MQLHQIASLLRTSRIVGDGGVYIKDMTLDSRQVKQGDLFVCIPGYSHDGHQFAAKAVESGATSLVVERELPLAVPQLLVSDARYAAAIIAKHLFHDPSRKIRMIGITGTNGKTTTSMMIEHILTYVGHKTGLMGTIRTRFDEFVEHASQTTSDAIALQRMLRRMSDRSMEYCVMEVSSHALDQGRVLGIEFRSAIFTNLTRDHLDYHKTMEQYIEAKGLLFSRLGNAAEHGPSDRKFAILNADDPVSTLYRRQTAAQVITYGIEHTADVRAEQIQLTPKGTSFFIRSFAGEEQFHSAMVGKFNVYNMLAAITAALLEDIPLSLIKEAAALFPGVEGRVERVEAGQPFTVIVDYAHTPDGLLHVLHTIKELSQGRIITVFGCGGDRDATKRSMMGRISAEFSDFTIITSDNPRSENPTTIAETIASGCLEADASAKRYEIILDRRLAIKKAVEMANPEDVVLIAGKGHETVQIMNGISVPFDDRAQARAAIEEART
jgi:UDP-N-acetylmuramoyl-L-alanyl-D-glutamate--2,6-diaminopimelate ligase